MVKTSKISGFYKLEPDARLEKVKEFAGLSDEEVKILKQTGNLEISSANRMIENVIGTFELPLGIATNFQINGKDYLIPMVIEEPSVVAAASNAAKMAREKGGFKTESTEPIMIGQIQLVDIKNLSEAKRNLIASKNEIIKVANEKDPLLVKLGGGAKAIEVRDIGRNMLVVHLLVNTLDAMGANAVNTMAEAVSPMVEKISGGKARFRIISNLANHRLARASAIFPKEALGGEEVVDRIIHGYEFAVADPYRAATHNKGVMNGVSAVTLATGNDTRAIEAGAHAYAAISGKYKPLTTWEKNKDGDLVGKIEIPSALGTIGGATAVHPTAKISLKILGVKNARELGEVVAAVGLAQNLAAMRAIAAEGIQAGHMKLHAMNIAATAGAEGETAEKIAAKMIEEKQIRIDRAKELLKEHTEKN